MIDSACNYINPYATASALAAATMPTQSLATPTAASSLTALTTLTSTPNGLVGNEFGVPLVLYNNNKTRNNNNNTDNNNNNHNNNNNNSNSNNIENSIVSKTNSTALKMEMQYPPQASSTGSASPNSSINSAPSSASVSPSIFPSPAQSFASISSSPPATASIGTASSVSPLSGSPAVTGHVTVTPHPSSSATDIGAAAVASAAYSWNTYSALPARTQFPYAQYASDYYGNVGMSATAAAANAWFSHQDRLYHQPWSSQTYAGFNFDDIAFQTQLQRRSVRCTCPNCTNEMSGLPPIVGPDERGRKQHICHIPGCERLYGKASHLKTHLRWHTGERPFLCLTCGKRFSRSDELQRHGRTHTNYRPYACPICSKKFSRSDHLSKHKKTHFKDKKSKKTLAAEAKGQDTTSSTSLPIKQEKSVLDVSTEKVVPSKISTTAKTQASTIRTQSTSVNTTTSPLQQQTHSQQQQQAQQTQQHPQQHHHESLHLKIEQPEVPAGHANPYTNLYHHHHHHQGSSLFHTLSTGNTYASASGQQNTFDLWNSHHHHHHHHQQQQAQHQQQQQQHQHQQQQQQAQQQVQQQKQQQQQQLTNSYTSLALQSETQLAAEYGLTMSSPNNSNSAHSQLSSHSATQAGIVQSANSATSYSSLFGQMKSEYPSHIDFASNSSRYSNVGTSFHHAASHNPWAAYQHSHAAA